MCNVVLSISGGNGLTTFRACAVHAGRKSHVPRNLRRVDVEPAAVLCPLFLSFRSPAEDEWEVVRPKSSHERSEKKVERE